MLRDGGPLERALSGFIRAQATKPRGDGATAHRRCVCVCIYTNTHLCTQVRQLCLDRATLPVTFPAQVHQLFVRLAHSPSARRRPPESLEDVCAVQMQSISRTFQFHQVSDEGGLRLPGGAAALGNKSDATPNV